MGDARKAGVATTGRQDPWSGDDTAMFPARLGHRTADSGELPRSIALAGSGTDEGCSRTGKRFTFSHKGSARYQGHAANMDPSIATLPGNAVLQSAWSENLPLSAPPGRPGSAEACSPGTDAVAARAIRAAKKNPPRRGNGLRTSNPPRSERENTPRLQRQARAQIVGRSFAVNVARRIKDTRVPRPRRSRMKASALGSTI